MWGADCGLWCAGCVFVFGGGVEGGAGGGRDQGAFRTERLEPHLMQHLPRGEWGGCRFEGLGEGVGRRV